MAAEIDRRLGYSAQLEQAEHGWRVARDGDPAVAVAWLVALGGILERVNDSAALGTIESTYHDGLRDLSERVAALVAEARDGATAATATFRERGDRLFADALRVIDGAGL